METHFSKLTEWDVPLSNVAFTEGEDKDTFNRIEPTRDQEIFTKKFADILESFGYSPENAQQVALSPFCQIS